MDHLSQFERSINMSKIKSKNTKPEILVRSFLHKNGFRFKLNNKLPGKLDVYLKKYKTAVFVHGCFWHSHNNCKRSGIPKSNKYYWENKLEKNILRFKEVSKKLKKIGLKVIVIWECQANNDKILSKGNL